jgi:hypothetical protein
MEPSTSYEIKHWVSLYGVLQSDFEEEATVDEVVNLLIGTRVPEQRVPQTKSPCMN